MSAKKRKYFGTDGVRGVANVHPMTPEFVMRLGQAAAKVLTAESKRQRPVCLIGKDTRISGGMLEAALTAGLNAVGVDVVLCGVLPTPGLAYMVTKEQADFGAVISASHNPFYDNGVKFVGSVGYKLTDEQELNIEALVDEGDEGSDPRLIRDGEVGSVRVLQGADEAYITHALSSMQGRRLEGLKVALDNANGASSVTSTETLRRLGAQVEVFHSTPNGLNINANCGCTHGEVVEDLVKRTGAQVGVSHDGDADRVLLCDETGSRLTGDEMIAIAAANMLRKGTLHDKTVVATVMSNYGLDDLVTGLGGRVIRTSVGDRYVIAEMRKHGFNFGAEESGHIVFGDHATTGDGLVAALQILRIMMETGQPLSELRQILKAFPQAKRNLKVRIKPPEEELVQAQQLIKETEQKLGGLGRVLLRYSGTEPLIRLLVEGRDAEYIERQANRIAEAITLQIGA